MRVENAKTRYLYIDNLRLLMIIFVVLIHYAVTYSGIGSWYLMDAGELDAVCTIVFGLFQSFTQAYFMGFLFLISGYFVAGSYDKKGAARFISERLIRLGIPTLIYMLVITPFIIYVLLGNRWDRPLFPEYYVNYILSLQFLGGSGPLWFALALLIFNCIYVLIRILKKERKTVEKKKLPGMTEVLLLILLISVMAFLIRLVQPIDTSILNMQLCFFSQYVILFVVGVKAGRNDWFSQISYQTGHYFLLTALIPGILFWVLIMIAGGALNGGFSAYKGGLNWQSALYAIWESFISVAMSIGMIGIFQEKYNKQPPLVKVLSDNSFCVYMFHSAIIISVSLLLLPLKLYPLVKFLAAAVIGLPLCFLASNYIFRRIPLLKKVL